MKRPLLHSVFVALFIALFCVQAIQADELFDFESESTEEFVASPLSGPSRYDPDVKDQPSPPPPDDSVDDPQMAGPFSLTVAPNSDDLRVAVAEVLASTSVARIPDELLDPAFDRYVDAQLLGQAWESQDAAALTDVALQVAEGERVLMRTHKLTPADKLFGLAAKLAQEAQDQATLDRLTKAADQLGKKDLLAQLQSSKKLGGATRDAGPSVSLDNLTADEVSAYGMYSTRLKQARVAGDGATLHELVEEIRGNTALTEPSRKHLMYLIEHASAALPKDAGPDGVVQTLSKLGDASRGIFDNTPLANTPFDTSTWIPKNNSTGSGLQVVTSPYIDSRGNVWSGSGDGGPGFIVGKAQMQWSASTGAAYWVSNYRNHYGRVQPRRADSRYDKGATNSNVTSIPLSRYSINSSGDTYFRSSQGTSKYMGKAQRKRSTKTGMYAWVYTLGDGRQVYRYDDGKTNGG